MSMHETVTLARECSAIEIPSGIPVVLAAGSEVTITQSLGGSYTVYTHQGTMAQILGRDADALGKVPPDSAPKVVAPGALLSDVGEAAAAELGQPPEELVLEQLRTVYDPEIPVNVVELGLVYSCRILPLPSGRSRVEVDMTLTAPGCGMGSVLKVDAEQKILTVPGVEEADVQIVFDPPWDQSRMSEAARLHLGLW